MKKNLWFNILLLLSAVGVIAYVGWNLFTLTKVNISTAAYDEEIKPEIEKELREMQPENATV